MKTDIQKIDSVIQEYERRLSIANESLGIATDRQRLLGIVAALREEINRLLMVKAELMARRQLDNEIIMRVILFKRRFRALSLTN